MLRVNKYEIVGKSKKEGNITLTTKTVTSCNHCIWIFQHLVSI